MAAAPADSSSVASISHEDGFPSKQKLRHAPSHLSTPYCICRTQSCWVWSAEAVGIQLRNIRSYKLRTLGAAGCKSGGREEGSSWSRCLAGVLWGRLEKCPPPHRLIQAHTAYASSWLSPLMICVNISTPKPEKTISLLQLAMKFPGLLRFAAGTAFAVLRVI